MTQLAIVIFAVTDVRRAVEFYRMAFDASEALTTPNYVELELRGATRIGLFERSGFGRNIGRVPPTTNDVTSAELYFRVEAIDAAIAKLEAAGARLLSAVSERPWGETVAYYADPDGNVIAVAAR